MISTGNNFSIRKFNFGLGHFLFGLLIVIFTSSKAFAAEIQAISLKSAPDMATLRVELDQAARYQVYDLDGPPRLVLVFPDSQLNKKVQPLKNHGIIRSVFPLAEGSTARLEISLARKATYKIEEVDNNLLVSFTSEEPSVNKSKVAILKDIEVRDKNGVSELILRGENLDTNTNAFMTNNNRTLILDFWGAKSLLPKDNYSFPAEKIRQVTVGSADGRLRLVVSLLPDQNTRHQVSRGLHQVVVRVGSVKPPKKAGQVVVEAVEFQPDDRVAHLQIRTDRPDPIVNIRQKNDHVLIDVKKAALAVGQERTLDVSAFPGPIRQVDAYTIGSDSRIVARLREKVNVTSFQSGNVLTLNFEPMDLVAARKKMGIKGEQLAYTGKKVSFDFKDIDIRNALKLIAEMSNLNIIMSDDVSGTLTMRLIDVPWDQALDLILSARGLGKKKEGNVMRVAPVEVLQKEAEARKQMLKSVEDVDPLVTEFIELGYASVNDVKTILEGGSVKSTLENLQNPQQGASTTGLATTGAATETTTAGGGGVQQLQLLSERGSILMDERSNTLIITDTQERINNIKRLINAIDKPLKQVMIEARIVEASDEFERNLGIRWGGTYNDPAGPRRFGHQVQGSASGTNLVDLPVTGGVAGSGGAVSYSLSTLSGVLNLDLELQAAESEGKVKIISNPRVFTSNLQEAIIEQDQQIPFQTVSVTGGATTTASTLESSKLTLKVTPQITADNRIIMDLIVNKDTPTKSALSATGDPVITKKTVQTKLTVGNGETVVLGGIYTRDVEQSTKGVPLLKDIPLLGLLFKNKSRKDNRTELLIFITPKIVGGESQEISSAL